MNITRALRVETEAGVRSIILCRPGEYNTITPALRDELAAAIDDADTDPEVRVILLRADGPAFCAGYGLDWATEMQLTEAGQERVWDSVMDLRMMSQFVNTYMKLWYANSFRNMPWHRVARSARFSTASPVTRRRVTTSWLAPKMPVSDRLCANVTIRSGIMVRGRNHEVEKRKSNNLTISSTRPADHTPL